MDHDAVCTGLYKGKRTGKRIFHSLFQDKALDTGNDHEIIRQLGFLTGGDLLGELLDRCLGLLDFGTEERILLKALLIFDNDCGNAHSLEASYGIDEMLGKSAGVSVENDRLRGHFRDILDRSETRGHIDKLDVRLTLGRTVTKRADPHGVELVKLSFVLDDSLFHDQSRQTGMGFHRLHDRRHLDQLTQTLSSIFRHRQLLTKLKIDLSDLVIKCVRYIHDLSAIGRKKFRNMLADRALRTFFPVIAMHDEVRMDQFDHIVVVHLFLKNDLIYARDRPVKTHTLVLGDRREFVIADQGFVGKASDDDTAEFSCFIDDIQMTLVDHICTKTCIGCFHDLLLISCT